MYKSARLDSMSDDFLIKKAIADKILDLTTGRYLVTHTWQTLYNLKHITWTFNVDANYLSILHSAFPKIVLIGYQTIAFMLSFFRNVISKSNQIRFFEKRAGWPNCFTYRMYFYSALKRTRHIYAYLYSTEFQSQNPFRFNCQFVKVITFSLFIGCN